MELGILKKSISVIEMKPISQMNTHLKKKLFFVKCKQCGKFYFTDIFESWQCKNQDCNYYDGDGTFDGGMLPGDEGLPDFYFDVWTD